MKDKKWKLKWKARRQLRNVKARGLHLSPSILSNEKTSHKEHDTIQKKHVPQCIGESIYFTGILPDCKWTECEIKAELQQKILKRDQKGRICRNHLPKSDQTAQFRPQGIHPCILLRDRPAITEARRRLRQAAFREVKTSRRCILWHREWGKNRHKRGRAEISLWCRRNSRW